MTGAAQRFYREITRLRETASLTAALPKFFRETITVQKAEDEIERALERREDTFLQLVKAHVYEQPGNPYLKLLRIAGCEFGDLREQVRSHGLEPTLERLAREGLYLTSDEYKGKTPVVRAGQTFSVRPEDFACLHRAPGIVSQSSGTNNRPVPSRFSLDLLGLTSFAVCILYSAHNLFSHSHAVYDTLVPAGAAMYNLLLNAKLGIATERWFARRNPLQHGLAHGYYLLTASPIVLTGRRFGPGFPRPEVLDAADIRPVIAWISERRRQGRACCIRSTASSAAKIAREALQTGVPLEGTMFVVSGDPLTESKYEIMVRAGAAATARYSFAGGGNVGLGCVNPAHIDEVHVNQHMLALIDHPQPARADGHAIHPLLYTTLHPFADKFLLNVENGDYATLTRRDCGCRFERIGLGLHLHNIRSFEKFTSEGMNYFYGDLFELLEKSLPAEFGGGPGDYQLTEEEDANGQTRLSLIVHPVVGELDEAKLLSRLQESLGQRSRADLFQTKVWQAAGTIRIRRAAPYASPRGKILPLHLTRRNPSQP